MAFSRRRSRGVAHVENVTEIARSPEAVFDYCVDLAREPEWNPKARRVAKLTDGATDGERVPELLVSPGGAVGDRAWALREPESGRIASAKKYPALLAFRAVYETEPTPEMPGRIRIEAPDGRRFKPDDEDASAVVSEIVGARPQFASS
jgi:MOSC N-terminal beta barrel domain